MDFLTDIPDIPEDLCASRRWASASLASRSCATFFWKRDCLLVCFTFVSSSFRFRSNLLPQQAITKQKVPVTSNRFPAKMEKKGKETYVLEHLRPYLIHSPGITKALEALRFNIGDFEYRLILRKLQKLDEVSGWNILLDSMKRSPTSEAFTEFRRIVHCDEIFLHIKEMFENRCKEIGLETEAVAPSIKPMGKKKTAELGLPYGRSKFCLCLMLLYITAALQPRTFELSGLSA